jgi:tRNA modification GTPase
VYQTDDTIAAIASAPGGAVRGIVRLSGPAVISILETCFRPLGDQPLDAIRSATVLSGTIGLPGIGGNGLSADVYFWPNERSYTRQRVAEIHTIGSPPLLSALLETLCAAGVRAAEPGEFTLRAFLAGRLDLTQAEAVLGIIDARGEQEFQNALAQLAGGLARPLNELRDSLLDLLAQLEAGLDFVEEDIQFITPQQVANELNRAADAVARLAAQLAERAHSNELARVALVGWPNVGKSSLFNALSRPSAALVGDEPGTTRDYLTATLDLGPIGCQLIDTAGAEPDRHEGGDDFVALAAQRLAAIQSSRCDVRVLCLDSGRPLNDWEQGELAASPLVAQLVVLTKCDVPCRVTLPCNAIPTSAAKGFGLEAVRQSLREAIVGVPRNESAANLTAERCAESIRAAGDSLSRASSLNRFGGGEELMAAEIRTALAELGRVVGAVYTDDILDRIFSRFCIGK